MASSTENDHSESTPQYPAFMIVGTGRCGSTLLQSMLIAHPDICMGHETSFFFNFDPVAFGFDDPLDSKDIERYLDSVSQQNTLEGRRKHTPELLDRYSEAVRGGMLDSISMLRWVLESGIVSQEGTVIGEKTPGHWMKLDRILELGLECKIIHLVRDPRDVCESLLRMPWWPSDSYAHAARHCRNTLRGCLRWDKKLGPRRHLVVRYEDLVASPAGVLFDVCGFLGLQYDDRMLSHESAAGLAFSEDLEPHKLGSRRAVDGTMASRYRSTLSRSQILRVESVVGNSLLKHFGYKAESSWLGRRVDWGSRKIRSSSD